MGALAARLDRNNMLLAQLVASNEATASNTAKAAEHAAKTADNTDEIKRKPGGGGPRSTDDILREQEVLKGIKHAELSATL